MNVYYALQLFIKKLSLLYVKEVLQNGLKST